MTENYIYVYKYANKIICFVSERGVGTANEMFTALTGVDVAEAVCMGKLDPDESGTYIEIDGSSIIPWPYTMPLSL